MIASDQVPSLRNLRIVPSEEIVVTAWSVIFLRYAAAGSVFCEQDGLHEFRIFFLMRAL
jgi:hypothetical protein